MLIRLLKLYSIPETFTPITFRKGINLILGEKTDSSNDITTKKTNGVGKSMCIEFINFCLLKKSSDSRVMKIPDDLFPVDTVIALDLEINNIPLTIKRTKKNPEQPIITIKSEDIIFDKLDDALNYLTSLLYDKNLKDEYPSFRELLSPISRDEKSEFKDIIKCFSNPLIPKNFIPHLFLFGIDLNLYRKTREKLKEIEDTTKQLTKIKNKITFNGKKTFSDAKAELNELHGEIEKMEVAIESLKSNDTFEIIQKDLIKLEGELDSLRIRQKLIKSEVDKIKIVPKHESISEEEIQLMYNRFKSGLGDIIIRSLEQVKSFQSKIETFQQTLIEDKLLSLTKELKYITSRINSTESEYSNKLKIIDKKGVLKDLKTSLSIYNAKSEESSKLISQFKEFDEFSRAKKELNAEKDSLLLAFDKNVEKMNQVEKDFTETVLSIHEFIMGNRKASFYIKVMDISSKKKEPISFEMRIDTDGSYSVDRMKVFIYDIALLFNQYTRKNHTKLLIHDNLFNVDQDTLVRSLNYLSNKEDLDDSFQYILTLNKDMIENEEKLKLINLDIDSHKRASFTKKEKFLKFDYQEKNLK